VDHVMGEEGAQSKEQILEELDILLQWPVVNILVYCIIYS
jgi:hypothetical protein